MAGRRPFEDHAAIVAALLGGVQPGSEAVPLGEALGRVLADDVRSPIDLPPFRNSQMDGWAARAADLADGVVLPVDGVQPAARAEPRALPPGRLVKVMTGAPLPDGADAVVPVEDAEPEADGVRILVARAPGEFVREAGSDLAAGSLLLPAGTLLAPRHLAALAASGVARPLVRRRLRVAVVATGAEVVPPGVPLAHGQVYETNGAALAALAALAGCEVVQVGLVPDDPDAFATALHAATDASDLVITAGGISKGDFEVVRQVLEPLGADVAEVAMQPGGPQATARVDGVPVVALPGNPVSAQVSFTVLVRPVLRRLAGLPPVPVARLRLAEPVAGSPAGRRQWLRGRQEDGLVHLVAGPGSHLVAAMARADVLIDVPAGATDLPAGAEVAAVPL